MNASPIGGNEVAPELPVGELVFVDFIKFETFPSHFYHYFRFSTAVEDNHQYYHF